jgi:G:T-mismatch repair DNA endonuclease (very short patch repair protein)
LKCYARDTVNKVSEKTMHDLHQATMEKTQYLKDRGLHVVEMWECDMKKEFEYNEDMKHSRITMWWILWNHDMLSMVVEPTQRNSSTNAKRMRR